MAGITSKTSKIITETIQKDKFLKAIQSARTLAGKDITEFKFKKARCRILNDCEEVKLDSKGIIYWMCRECRVEDNWCMLYAQKLALKNNLPLHVCFFAKECKELYPTTRQFKFLIKGLEEVEKELKELNISFNVFDSDPLELNNIVKSNNIGAVVCEFFPLRVVQQWQDKLKESLPSDVPFLQVDGHNVVPCWIASDKKEIAARTIRSKIVKKLPEFLTGFPEVCQLEEGDDIKSKHLISLKTALKKCSPKIEVDELEWAIPGSKGGVEMLRTFLNERLKEYGKTSNDPSKNTISNLSPWLHFGQISAQRCALEVKAMQHLYKEQAERFLEELIVRKELGDNFCYYNEHYDTLEGADKWAQETLKIHSKDKRTYVYTSEQLEFGETHDHIWNCAQMQLRDEGKLHGYMRMYWAKKILEWTSSPEEALTNALWYNDKYSIDGSDPNGFVGVMWSIAGIHDHPWKEREIFGKVRYMVDYSLAKKFDIVAYCNKYKPGVKFEVSNPKKKSDTGKSEAKAAVPNKSTKRKRSKE